MNSMQPTFTSIREARQWASLFLQNQNREERVADLLLEDFLGWSPSQLLAYETDPLPEPLQQPFVEAVQAHAETGVPYQHLTGLGHFYGREFKVNSHVLIPRPETEELIVGVLELVKSKGWRAPKITDLGTGSGVIAVTLALELPDSEVKAVDISVEALQTARDNANIHKADVQFYQGNFLLPVKDAPVDIIVSNPPYISYGEKESMDDTVVDFDPELALFAEEEGLAAYRTILEQISKMKEKPSAIAFEIGYQQGRAVAELFHNLLPQYQTEVRQDINGKDRMIFGIRADLKD